MIKKYEAGKTCVKENTQYNLCRPACLWPEWFGCTVCLVREQTAEFLFSEGGNCVFNKMR